MKMRLIQIQKNLNKKGMSCKEQKVIVLQTHHQKVINSFILISSWQILIPKTLYLHWLSISVTIIFLLILLNPSITSTMYTETIYTCTVFVTVIGQDTQFHERNRLRNLSLKSSHGDIYYITAL